MGRNAKIALIVAIVVGAVVLLGIGFLAGGFLLGQNTGKDELVTNNLPPQKVRIYNPLFSYQSAGFEGRITKIEGDKVTLVNGNNITGELKLAKGVTIYKFTGKSQISTASSGLKNIELDKKVSIQAQFKDNDYQVVSIIYPPESNQ